MNLRPGKNNSKYMVYLVGKFTEPGELVADCIANTFPVSKAFKLLQNDHIFVDYDIHRMFIDGSNEIIVEFFSLQLLNLKSYLTISNVAFSAVKSFIYKKRKVFNRTGS